MQASVRDRNFVPLYIQVEDWIREKIDSGEWAPDQRISSERELMDRFGVSRATVLRALNTLVHEGILYRQQGKGTFVAQKKYEQGLMRFYSFSEDVKRQGLLPSTVVLEIDGVASSKYVASALELEPGQEVAKLKRLRLINDVPIVLETSYLPLALFPGILEMDHVNVPLYDLVRKEFGVSIARAREYLEATLADEEASHHLGVDIGAPLLFFERRTRGSNGDKAIELCRGVIRGDKYRYYVDLA